MRNVIKRNVFLVVFLFSTMLSVGCVKKVTRVKTDDIIDISGRWNDTDARLTAKEMIDTIFAGWYHDFNNTHNSQILDSELVENDENRAKSKKRKPVIVVGEIKNKSSEHIESDTFIKDIERELINRRLVRIITNNLLREKLRDERSSQRGNTTTESQKKFGKELGADYMMFGTINTIVDASEDDRVIFYQINLELVDLETGEVVWMGDKKIKKYRSKTGKVRSHQKGELPDSSTND